MLPRRFPLLLRNAPKEPCVLHCPSNRPYPKYLSPTLIIRSYQKESKLEWSYLMKTSPTPLLGLTVGGAVDRAASLFGDNEALVSLHQSVRRTFTQVRQESEELAAGLNAMGLQRGDRLGIWGPNSYEWYLTELAAAKAGLILVNINPSYRPSELKFCLNKVAMKGIVCAEQFKTSNYYDLLSEVIPELPSSPAGEVESKDVPHLRFVITMSKTPLPGTFSFEEITRAGGSENEKAIDRLATKLQFDDPCNIQFTSGTTGLPKAALLSHHGLVNNAYFVGLRCGYDQKTMKICLPVPLYHCFGCVIGVLGGALFGCSSVFPNDGFDPAKIVASLEEEKINSCYGTPTMFVDVLKEYRKSPVSLESLSSGIMAGAPCPEELVNALIHELKMRDIIVMYGMTETSPVTFQGFPSDSPLLRATTIGYPSDHTEVKIVDEEGEVVRVGESGELWVRGYCTFLEYWDDELKTNEILRKDKWLKTGDLAVMNEEGYGSIIGRIKDMIIRGGENIYPAELENFYMSHPEIIEAQVFGMADERMGEEVAMWIRVKDPSRFSTTDLKGWSKGKIAHYKIPKYILTKTEFPTTVTGKVQKFKMQEITAHEIQKSS